MGSGRCVAAIGNDCCDGIDLIKMPEKENGAAPFVPTFALSGRSAPVLEN